MTKQKIIERCIAAYTEAIEVCGKLNFEGAQYWLDSKYLFRGVCYFVMHQLDIHIGSKNWVLRYQRYKSAFWATCPMNCRTHPELMKSLKIRLEILKRELEIPEQP
jgi:hypothetical protein